MTRPLIDIHGHTEGCCATLNGEVLTVGTLTHCARAQIAAYQALDALEAIFRIEGLHPQRRAA